MERWLGGLSELFYAILRLFAGVLFACHGAQKLFGVLGGHKMLGSPLMTAAGIIELGGGVLIALGLFAGWAAFLAAGQMAVAYFMVHAHKGTWPIQNGGELAVLYCFLFLFIASRGSGPYGVDRGAARRSSRRR
ncbi:MAG TPA: DoxX family protein [Vicinamibacteria bacterium]|nr:DoxX family protein [Vicinamibacteria bacterium]